MSQLAAMGLLNIQYHISHNIKKEPQPLHHGVHNEKSLAVPTKRTHTLQINNSIICSTVVQLTLQYVHVYI